MKVGKYYCLLFFFVFSVAEQIPNVGIKNNETDFYKGNKILVELSIDDSCKILDYDSSLNKIEDIIVNKYRNGKFTKYFLIRYELFLPNEGEYQIKPFTVEKDGVQHNLSLSKIDVKKQPELLTSIGARVTVNKTNPYIGEPIKIKYEIYHSDQQIVDLKLPELPNGLEIIKQTEEKSRGTIIYNLTVVANQAGEFNFDKVLFTTANKGSIIHFMGFGKVYESNNLTIKSYPIPDNACLVANSDVKFDLQLTDNLEKTNIAKLSVNGIFTCWPQVDYSDNLRIYNSQKNISDNITTLELVVQPVSSGSAEINVRGNLFDTRDKSLRKFDISKKVHINLAENILENENPKITKKSDNIFYSPINFKYWYLLILILVFLVFFRHFFLQNILLNIKYLYNLLLFKFFLKINYINYAKYFAKNLLDMKTSLNLRNIINKILYSKR